MATITDIFSVIETPKQSCSCKVGDNNDRNDMINLASTPLVLEIYRGQPFKLFLDNIPKECTLTFKCDAFNKKFTYYNSQYVLSLSDDETIKLAPNTYTYYVYKNGVYWYTGTLKVRDSDYYTDGIGMVKYQLSLIQGMMDDFTDKVNSITDQYDSLSLRVETLEDFHVTANEISQLCDEVYQL